MKFAAVLLLAAISVAPAFAQTDEKTATTIGYVVEGYMKRRFLCLAAGIPMPTWAEQNPSLVSSAERAKREFPDFYQLGAERAAKEIGSSMDEETAQMICKMLRDKIKSKS